MLTGLPPEWASLPHESYEGVPPEVAARMPFAPDPCWWCRRCGRAVDEHHWLLASPPAATG